MIVHVNVVVVVPQMVPDPEFPTVRYPNPEEGKSALVSRSVIHYIARYIQDSIPIKVVHDTSLNPVFFQPFF